MLLPQTQQRLELPSSLTSTTRDATLIYRVYIYIDLYISILWTDGESVSDAASNGHMQLRELNKTIGELELGFNQIHSVHTVMAEKQLKIKFGVLKRVDKDLKYYKKEFESQKIKVDKMRDEGKDAHDIKQQEQVLQETETMLPDCESRIQNAVREIKEHMKDHEADLKDTELYGEVTEYLSND